MPDIPAAAPRRALITGGAGFIGSHLAEALLAADWRVTSLDNLATGRAENIAQLGAEPRFRFVAGSVADEPLLDRLTAESDVVFHLAAAVGVRLIVQDPINTFETNVLGTHAVLGAASRHGKTLLLASTSEIYGKAERVPFREDDDRVLGPTTVARWSYATSKAVDEFLSLGYHRQRGLPVVIVRLFNTVGPRQTGQYGMVVPRFVRQALAGEPITVYGDGGQSRCFCDVADAVRAMLLLIERPEAVGRVFNIGSAEETTILALARRVLALTGGDPERVALIPYEQAYEAGFEDMRRRIPDTSRLRDLTGWAPVIPLDETLRRVIAHERMTVQEPALVGSPGGGGRAEPRGGAQSPTTTEVRGRC